MTRSNSAVVRSPKVQPRRKSNASRTAMPPPAKMGSPRKMSNTQTYQNENHHSNPDKADKLAENKPAASNAVDSQMKVIKHPQGDRTPPKANGVNGFMFASPNVKSPSKKQIAMDALPKMRLFPQGNQESMQPNQDDPAGIQKSESVLFSPYPCHPHHQYSLRSTRYRNAMVHYQSQHSSAIIVETCQESLDLSDLESDDALESYMTVYRLKSLPVRPPVPASCIPAKSKDDRRLTLVLDLDETLVHCSTDASTMPSFDIHFNVEFQQRQFNVYAKKRPHVEEFLKHVAMEFEVIIFTASQKIYADKLLDRLDPNRLYTKHRLFRDSCVSVDGTFVKDLSVLGRDLSKTVIVDNALEAFSFQVSNGIPIKSFFCDDDDNELYKLYMFLKRLVNLSDVRTALRDAFRLDDKINELKAQMYGNH